MEQKGLVRLHLVGLAQQIVHGEPLQKAGGSLFEADGVRQQHQAIFRHVVQLAVGAQRRLAIDHAIARLKARDRAADALHHARRFGAEARGQGGNRIKAAAHVGIDIVNADGAVLYLHFAFSRIGRIDIYPLQYLRSALRGELNTLCHFYSCDCST